LGESFEGVGIVGSDGGFALVDVEAVVMPGEELVGLAGGNPLEFQQSVEDAVAEELGELLATSAADEVELVCVVENPGGGEAVDVGVVSEVIAKGVDGEDDASPAVGNSRLFAQPVLQGASDEVAELSQSVRLFTKDISKHSRYSKDPVPMWDGQADFIANKSGGIESPSLVAAGATAAPFAGKG